MLLDSIRWVKNSEVAEVTKDWDIIDLLFLIKSIFSGVMKDMV